jgi:hypothetical protein
MQQACRSVVPTPKMSDRCPVDSPATMLCCLSPCANASAAASSRLQLHRFTLATYAGAECDHARHSSLTRSFRTTFPSPGANAADAASSRLQLHRLALPLHASQLHKHSDRPQSGANNANNIRLTLHRCQCCCRQPPALQLAAA